MAWMLAGYSQGSTASLTYPCKHEWVNIFYHPEHVPNSLPNASQPCRMLHQLASMDVRTCASRTSFTADVVLANAHVAYVSYLGDSTRGTRVACMYEVATTSEQRSHTDVLIDRNCSPPTSSSDCIQWQCLRGCETKAGAHVRTWLRAS